MKTRMSFIALPVFGLLLISASAIAGDPGKATNPAAVSKTTSDDVYHPVLINKIFSYYGNNGDGAYNPYSSDNEGLEWQKGDNKHVVYEEGIVWGCYQAGTLKTGGSMYRKALQAGPIISRGTNSTPPVADNPTNPTNGIYRVRPDIPPIPGVTDPADPRAAGELSIIQNSEVPFIGRYESVPAAQILQQYWLDWQNWPAAQGAPFTDVDHNGAYDPAVDVPGVPLSDQTLWYVANDLDSIRTLNLSGSKPIGLEMQKTIWAYNLGGALAQTVYSRTRILNKSGVPLDSMFIMQWVDPDIGDAADDFAGCDTLMNLGYAYNGNTVDAIYGSAPPAVGYRLLQGPIVAGTAGDTAMFGDAYRPGFKNLPMSAFVSYSTCACATSDPVQGQGGDIQLYRLMNSTSAYSGAPFIDPTTNQITRFVLPGDPVKATDGSAGWVDGMAGLSPSDKRFCVISGPFPMARNDTQEVVVATIAGQGADRFSSITALKDAARVVGAAFKRLGRELPPVFAYSIAHSGDNATVTFRADAQKVNATAVTVNLKTYTDSIVGSVALLDDGLHGDGAAGDGIFGGSVQITQQPSGLIAEAVVSYPDGLVMQWPRVLENIATAKIAISAYSVVSDNINNDGIVNPGENIRYGYSLTNESSLSFIDLSITANPVSYPVASIVIPMLPGNATQPLVYDARNPYSYQEFNVPPQYTDSTFSVELLVSDPNHNVWRDTLVFPVQPIHSRVYHSPLTRIAGTVPGDFDIMVVDSSKVKNHVYVIRGAELNEGVSGYSVKDSSTGVILIENHALPDSLGHTSPIVDGFKILLGSVSTKTGMQQWSIPQGVRQFSPVGGYPGLGLEGFSSAYDPSSYDIGRGTIGMAGHFAYCGVATTLTKPSQYHTVLLKLAAVDNVSLWDPRTTWRDDNISYGYRYLRGSVADPFDSTFAPWIINKGPGLPYQDFNRSVPFSAWDMETTPPTRLAVGMMENNAVGGKVDGRYWPGNTMDDNRVAGEICLIFSTPYSDTPDPTLQVNLINTATPIMWVMTCARRSETPWLEGDQFQITAYHQPTSADVWTFNPSIVLAVQKANSPSAFALSQNYPNPFNPTTYIRYTIAGVRGQTSGVSEVRLAVYDILGRQVAELMHERQAPGIYKVRFDGARLASGVYFYRLQVGSFSQTKSMILMK